MSIEFVAIGSIIIDDIIDPVGRSNMGALGGGGSHAIAGMSLWSDQTALLSIRGKTLPATALDHLTALTDVQGIVRRDVPQPRFWQLFEADGTRQEVPRTDFEQFKEIPIRPDECPAHFASAQGVYLQTATAAEALAWVTYLKNLNPAMVILWEPWEIFYTPDNLSDFQEIAPYLDIISPQTVELSRMIVETTPQKQAALLFDYGVSCLALRLGAEGSLVGTATALHHLPAFPAATVVDETGAGNAYCGGFVVGYIESDGDPLLAGAYGTVSASFTLEQVGVPHLPPDSRQQAEERLQK